MARYELLNNIDHADYRVITESSASLGDDVMFAVCYPFECRQIQAHYPIVIYNNPKDQQLFPVALFGFENKENLFLSPSGWDATYVPATMRRGPFLIGFQEDSNDPMADTKRVVTVDVEHPRLNKDMGQAIFSHNGGYSEYLETISQLLEAVYLGTQQNKQLMQALQTHNLLQPLAMSATLANGQHITLEGFLVIDDEAVQRLSADAVAALQEQGLLMPIYMMVASLSQLRPLLQRKNAKS